MGAFDGKVVLVTGGAQGIGSVVSRAFAREGAVVAMGDLDPEAGGEHEATLAREGLHARYLPLEVADEESVRSVMTEIGERHGRIDVLVNNAGLHDRIPLAQRELASWRRILDVNLTGPFLCARHALPHLPEGASIINIASTRALMSEADTEPYSASKGGLVALTHSLAVSLADRRIRVNAISPGWIDVSACRKASRRAQEVLRPIDHVQHPCRPGGTSRGRGRSLPLPGGSRPSRLHHGNEPGGGRGHDGEDDLRGVAPPRPSATSDGDTVACRVPAGRRGAQSLGMNTRNEVPYSVI